jgi:xanthine phosphoribosyltransferase
MPKETKLTWSNIEEDINLLTRYLTIDDFDAIVGIGRGGLIPAVLLSNSLSIKPVVNFSIQSYIGKKQTSKITLGQVPDKEFFIKNKNILVVDDLSDRGSTLHYVQKYFNKIKVYPTFLTLYIKESTKFVPDLYARSYKDNEWLIFPWEKE